jgi:hypothetical protein
VRSCATTALTVCLFSRPLSPAARPPSSSVSASRLGPKSVIAILPAGLPPTAPVATPAPPPAADHKSEQATLFLIQSELDALRTNLVPAVHSFLALSPSDPKEHSRLGELLLQSLLRLDAISTDTQWETARSSRKLAVKEVQALLDRLDDAWKAAH